MLWTVLWGVTTLAALVRIGLIRTGFTTRFPGATRFIDPALVVAALVTAGMSIHDHYAAHEQIAALESGLRGANFRVDAASRYGVIAKMTWNADEHDAPYGGKGIGTREYDELRSLMGGTYLSDVDHPGTYVAPCTPENLDRWQQAATKFPDFPFSYFGIATCGTTKGKPLPSSARDAAQKGLEIFRYTTSLDPHDGSHDQARAQLERLIAGTDDSFAR